MLKVNLKTFGMDFHFTQIVFILIVQFIFFLHQLGYFTFSQIICKQCSLNSFVSFFKLKNNVNKLLQSKYCIYIHFYLVSCEIP